MLEMCLEMYTTVHLIAKAFLYLEPISTSLALSLKKLQEFAP